MENLYAEFRRMVKKNNQALLNGIRPYQRESKKILHAVVARAIDYLEAQKYECYTRDYDSMKIKIDLLIISKQFSTDKNDTEDTVIVKNNYIRNMYPILRQFVEKYRLGGLSYDYKNQTISLRLNCFVKELKTALEAYYNLINNDLVSKELETLNNGQTRIDDTTASELFDTLYEKMFLDKHIVKLIRETSTPTDKQFVILEPKDIRVRNKGGNIEYRLSSQKDPKPKSIVIPEDKYYAFRCLIEQFMERYKLGAVCDEIDDKSFKVYFNCSLADLMDAYYMEKQRIEYYTSGAYLSDKKDPTAKKITL